MKQTAAERKHHPFSPSTLQAREASPYWKTVNSDTEASRAGTLQHESVDLDVLPEELSDIQAEAVVTCKNYWEKIVLNYPGGVFINEEYLPIDDEIVYDEDGNPWLGTTGGYVDRAIVSSDLLTADICDWKFGQWSVEPAETNLQGYAYALGLIKRYPTLQQITVHFVLPHRNEDTKHTFKRDDFDRMYLRVRLAVQRAMEAMWDGDLSKCSATTSSCLFCANVGKCPIVAEFALKVGKKFHPVEVPDSVTPSTITDPAQAGAGLEVASLLATWAKAYRAQATVKAIDNDDFMPEGYRLKSTTKRELIDPNKAAEIAKEYGLSDAQINEARSMTLGPLFTAARANAPRGSKEAAEEELGQKLVDSGAVEFSQPIVFLERLKS